VTRDRAALAGVSGAFVAPVTDRLARIALPLACALSWLVVASLQRDPTVAAEASYLALLTGGVLLAALGVAPRVGTVMGSAVVLLGSIPWALPGTADRGAATTLLLAATLAIAGTARGRWPGYRVVGLAVGAQLLARSEELLALSATDAFRVVGWAVLAAIAAIAIAARRGLHLAGLAGALAFVAGPGFTTTTTLALVGAALVVVVIAAIRPNRESTSRSAPSPALAALGASLAALTFAVAFVVTVLAAYPWLRADALYDAGLLLGLGGGWRGVVAAIAVLVAAVAASVVGSPFGLGSGDARSASMNAPGAAALAPFSILALLTALTLYTHPSAVATPIAREPVVLEAARPSWTKTLAAPARAATVVVDSSLSHAESLAAGTPIAEIRLTTERGVVTLPLRAGVDSAEWAARRPDVAAIAGFSAPAPYLHWVDPGRAFFGQRYRARLALDAEATIEAVEVRLSTDVPADLAATLFHLELTR
jgi:hypothetical protein